MPRTPPDQLPETPSEPVTVETEAQFDDIRTSAPKMLVEFYADWCGPCQEMEDPLAELDSTCRLRC